jgi:hypothetical protein
VRYSQSATDPSPVPLQVFSLTPCLCFPMLCLLQTNPLSKPGCVRHPCLILCARLCCVIRGACLRSERGVRAAVVRRERHAHDQVCPWRQAGHPPTQLLLLWDPDRPRAHLNRHSMAVTRIADDCDHDHACRQVSSCLSQGHLVHACSMDMRTSLLACVHDHD